MTPRRVPRRVVTHAPLCSTLPSNILSPKTVKIPALKGLNSQKTSNFGLFFHYFMFLFNPLSAVGNYTAQGCANIHTTHCH